LKNLLFYFQPLPEKHPIRKLDRFDPLFIKTREVALQKFAKRLADHPVLSFSKHFQMFLTLKQHVSYQFEAEFIVPYLCVILKSIDLLHWSRATCSHQLLGHI
jgi:hypothetical protein